MENLCIAFNVPSGFPDGRRLIVWLQVSYMTSKYTTDRIWAEILEVAIEADKLFSVLESNTRCNPKA